MSRWRKRRGALGRWSEGGGGRECGTMVAMATAVRVRTVRGKKERERGTGIRRWRRRKVEGRRGQRDSKRERERKRTLSPTQGLYFHNLPLCRF